jgi:hypothetical protein
MAGGATDEHMIWGDSLEMAKVAHIHGNTDMRSLDDIGVTAPTMECYAPFHFWKMGFVVKGDARLGKGYLRINHLFIMASRLKAIFVRHVGKRTGIL